MKKKTKSALISVLSLTAITMGTTAASLNYVPASASADNVLTPIAFTVDDGASIRIGLEEDGSGSQKATAYEKNGIRFTARMEEAVYEGLTPEQNIVFGILVLPNDYIAQYGAVTTESVFGTDEKDVYTISESETDKIRVAYVETKELKEDKDGSYYYNVSMVNLKPANKDREFVAVPYLKTIDNLGEVIYDVKATGAPYSMAYTAQVEYAKDTTDAMIKTALYDNYIKDLTETVSVDVEYAYGETKKTVTANVSLALGETLTTDKVKQALEENDEIDTSLYDFSGATLTVEGENVSETIVYANGKTHANIKLSYQASESEASVYDNLKGYYTTTDFGSIIFKSKNVAVYNADYGMSDTETVGTYKFYKDGVATVTLGDTTYFGEYDNNNKTCNITVGNDTYVYGEAVEVPATVYAKMRGYYESTDGSSAVINSDGSILVDLDKNGSYVVAYNAEEETFQMTATIIGGNTCTTNMEKSGNGYKLTINDTAYLLSNEKTLANEETYQTFAKTYEGTFYYPVQIAAINGTAAGDNYYTTISSKGTGVKTEKTYDSTISFSANGKVVYDGYDFYSSNPNMAYAGGAGANFILGTRYGSYVLFTDGTMKVNLPMMSNILKTGNTTVSASTKDTIFPATYALDDKTVTLDASGVKYWEDTLVYKEKTQSSTAVFENEQALYDAFSNAQSGKSEVTGVAGTFTAYRDNSTLFAADHVYYKFYNDKSLYVYCGSWNIKCHYTLNPISDTFGTITFTDYVNSSAGHIKQAYYSYFDGFFRLSTSLWLSNESLNHGAHNHFNFLYSTWDRPDNNYQTVLSTMFETIAGEGGSVAAPASKTYSSSAATLTLYNDGVLKIPTSQSGFNVSGGKATIDFKDGNGQKNITYDLVMKDNTSGKIFFNMDETPGVYDATQPDLYADGEYYLWNGSYVISFTYAGKAYTLAVGGYEELINVKGSIAGNYIGSEGTLTLLNTGVATYKNEECTWSYNALSIANGTLTIETNEGSVVGEYQILKNSVKVTIAGRTYIKEYTDLYTKYAGTYTANYTTTYIPVGATTGTQITVPMTLVLNSDGTFTAWGVKFDGQSEMPSTDYYELKSWRNGQAMYYLPKNHLGNEKTGTYGFTVVDGKLQIYLKFDCTSVGFNNKSYNITSFEGYSACTRGAFEFLGGYYARAIQLLQGLDNPSWWGGRQSTFDMPNQDGSTTSTTVTTVQHSGFEVYNYAAGEASDGVLNILFEAFSDTPITLAKQN